MKQRFTKAASVGLLVGILGFGGYTIAQAQDAPTTTTPTTVQPDQQAPATDRPDTGTDAPKDGNCDHEGEGRGGGPGGPGGGRGGDTGATTPSTGSGSSDSGAASDQ